MSRRKTARRSEPIPATAPDIPAVAPAETAELPSSPTKPVTLKALAEHLQLSPTTVSVVLNRSPVAKSIPQETQQRVFDAARKLRYRPNYMARSLRRQRSHSLGVLVPEISEAYSAGVMSGLEAHLIKAGYFYLMASHRKKPELLEEYLNMLTDRLVEGFILVATPIEEPPTLPTVSIAGHRVLDGVTNVVLDHDRAAEMAISHLRDLGHRQIAYFKGQPDNADTEDRWRAILETAERLGVPVDPSLTEQLSGDPAGEVFPPREAYEEGYAFGRKLLDRRAANGGSEMTALFAFNDVSAIGAMRAFLDAGLRVPEDISVIGFDDIQSAAFQNPSLTTVRQPLREMGELAGSKLLARLQGETWTPEPVTVEPQLMIRGSTGPPSSTDA